MKLLLRRDQKTISGLLSTSVVFVLEARAQLTEDEAENVRKYHMGKTILFTNYSSDIDKKSLIRDETLLIGAFRITIKSLMEGQHLETKDVTGLIEAERLLKEACKFFKLILDTAAQFGGEEIIEF